MFGLKNEKGERATENGAFVRRSDSKLLCQELENFCHLDEGMCFWDRRHGLSRRILFSRNKEAIKSEVRNKILEYYGDRITDVVNISVIVAKKRTSFSGEIKTIYGTTLAVGGERGA